MLSMFSSREAADAAWRKKAYINRLKEIVTPGTGEGSENPGVEQSPDAAQAAGDPSNAKVVEPPQRSKPTPVSSLVLLDLGLNSQNDSAAESARKVEAALSEVVPASPMTAASPDPVAPPEVSAAIAAPPEIEVSPLVEAKAPVIDLDLPAIPQSAATDVAPSVSFAEPPAVELAPAALLEPPAVQPPSTASSNAPAVPSPASRLAMNDADPLREVAGRIADNFMRAFTGAIKEAESGSVQEAESMLGTFMAMSTEIRGLNEQLAAVRADLDRVVEREEQKALELAKIEAFKRGFEASQQRTTEALISLATACDESSRMVASQAENTSAIQREFRQLQERVNQQAKISTQQSAGAVSVAAEIRAKLEANEGMLNELRQQVILYPSRTEIDERIAAMEQRLESQRGIATALEDELQQFRQEMRRQGETTSWQVSDAANKALAVGVRMDATQETLQDLRAQTDQFVSTRAELEDRILALGKRLSDQDDETAKTNGDLRELHEELRQQVQQVAALASAVTSETSDLRTRQEATEGQLQELRESANQAASATPEISERITALEQRLASQADAIKTLYTASQGFGAKQEILHGLLQKVQELASGNQPGLQLPDSL